MRTTIDRAGRIVVPKALRDALDLGADDEVEITEQDGRLIIERPPVPKRIVHTEQGAIVVADGPVPTLTVDQVRSALEQIRR